MVYLLILNKPWIPPIPMYVEQCLFPLYLVSAVAGYWGGLRVLPDLGHRVWSFGARRGLIVAACAAVGILGHPICAYGRRTPQYSTGRAHLVSAGTPVRRRNRQSIAG